MICQVSPYFKLLSLNYLMKRVIASANNYEQLITINLSIVPGWQVILNLSKTAEFTLSFQTNKVSEKQAKMKPL